jgi:hypothetical protein
MKRLLALDGEEDEGDITQAYGNLGVRQEWLLRPQELQPAPVDLESPPAVVPPDEIKVCSPRNRHPCLLFSNQSYRRLATFALPFARKAKLESLLQESEASLQHFESERERLRQELSRFLRLVDALRARVAAQHVKLAHSQRHVGDAHRRLLRWQHELDDQYVLRDRALADGAKWKRQRTMLANKLKRAQMAKHEIALKRQQAQHDLEAATLSSINQVRASAQG